MDVSSPAPQPFFSAGGPMYVSSHIQYATTSSSTPRNRSAASSPPPSVVGIGGKVAKPDYSEAKIVLAMVGLPARGKSYLSNKLMRYLKWLEYNVKVFNVGQLRRTRARQKAEQSGIKEDHTASYFSHGNEEATRTRDALAEDSLEMLIQWLKEGGNVGIHDATNSTISRRCASCPKYVNASHANPAFYIIFLESVCTDPALIAANVALKVSSGDPDYAHMSRADAERDFLNRIKQYESVYQGVNDALEPRLSYLKITDVGREVSVSHIHGYLQSRIAFYLMNFTYQAAKHFLLKGDQYNVEGKIGGDSPLSERGMQYAKALPALITDNIGDAPLTVWTSTLQRTIQSAAELPYNKLTWKSLDELDAGVCDGMTYDEIEEEYPEDFTSRDDDKFNYRYRGGESYRDVVVRLEPVIMELERQENILIIGHQVYGYFNDLPQADLPYIKIPLHTVIKLTPKAYGCDEERYTLPIGAVDTHRPKPHVAQQPQVPASSSSREYFEK
ncbi:bifunctional 6-phosphofructo-2-kinase/fructose-2,6-bisphosphate 2-phosphatase [Phellopilus nigrolimitatus]|nr:bifunctional 6-phosphofructo-2-kinase/fructose-2,6-bisphosphate 2-phosphatase [Phellopilus nigrolimitatus]